MILEGYGLTECSAGGFVNHPEDYKFGTVGPALPGSEVKLGEGDEVLIRGPHVMDGYHNLPEETAKTLDAEGWLHTGDKGALDADGFLTITGRIKELFKTSGGKYIAPPAIESKFKAICPYASQFMVFGEDAQLLRRAGHPRPRRDGGLGRGERHGRQVLLRDRRLGRGQGDGRRLRRRAQHQAQPLGDHQEVGAPRPRPHRSSPASSPRR